MEIAAAFDACIMAFDVGDKQSPDRLRKIFIVIELDISVNDNTAFWNANFFGNRAPNFFRKFDQVIAVRVVSNFLAGVGSVPHDGFAIIHNADDVIALEIDNERLVIVGMDNSHNATHDGVRPQPFAFQLRELFGEVDTFFFTGAERKQCGDCNQS